MMLTQFTIETESFADGSLSLSYNMLMGAWLKCTKKANYITIFSIQQHSQVKIITQ